MGGCQNKGAHRAPKGRENSREYWHFCLEHVREYNQSYNFFQGMNAGRGRALPEGRADRPSPDLEDGRQYRRQARAAPRAISTARPIRSSMFAELNGRGRWRPGPGAAGQGRDAQGDERRAQGAAGDGPSAEATLDDVKTKYKALVKQHHPDANGGDRSTEDRLIEIIKAYNYLKTVVREA